MNENTLISLSHSLHSFLVCSSLISIIPLRYQSFTNPSIPLHESSEFGSIKTQT